MKRFSDLTEQEVLALAISNEEDDSRIYHGFAQGLEEQYPDSAKIFREMADQEVQHRTELYNLYREKFGEYLPLIRKQDVSGFIRRKPLWLTRPLRRERLFVADEIEIALSYLRDIKQISFGTVGFVVIAYVIISATSNAVNLTDGLDGLAAGASRWSSVRSP